MAGDSGGMDASVRDADGLAAGPRGEGGHDRLGGVAEEPDGTVGEGEVRPAGVRAPEVEHVALVVEPPGAERVRPRRTPVAVEGADGVPLSDTEHHLGRAVALLPETAVPPAEDEVRGWRPL